MGGFFSKFEKEDGGIFKDVKLGDIFTMNNGKQAMYISQDYNMFFVYTYHLICLDDEKVRVYTSDGKCGLFGIDEEHYISHKG